MKNHFIPYITRTLGQICPEDGIGFSTIPDQIRKKSTVEGFHLNLLVCGRRGLGSTTLINSMFLSPLIDKARDNSINTTKNEVYENDICLSTTVTTYHDQDIKKILNYIDEKYEEYFEAEQGLFKPGLDPRVHLCIYMLPSDTIFPCEIEMMKELSKKCNFLPVIAKADTFTTIELIEYKDKISNMLKTNSIEVFYPSKDDDDHESYNETNDIVMKYPLAIFASVDSYDQNGVMKRGRSYNWAFLDIENEDINDFAKLRKLVVYNNLDELVLKTDTDFYNIFRKNCLNNEKLDNNLKKKRMMKVKIEMERILEERNKKKIERVKSEMEKLENDFKEKLIFESKIKKEEVSNSEAVN